MFLVLTCLYVLSATHSRKKKIQTRDTRTTKLMRTIERTMKSSLEPTAITQSSEAEWAVSCSKSVAWDSRKTNGVKPRIRETAFPNSWYPIPGTWLFTLGSRGRGEEEKKVDINQI